jgi:hypothetical protein
MVSPAARCFNDTFAYDIWAERNWGTGGKLLPYISGRQNLFKWIVSGTGARSSGVLEFWSQEFRRSGWEKAVRSHYYLEAIFLTNSIRRLHILQLLNSCNY